MVALAPADIIVGTVDMVMAATAGMEVMVAAEDMGVEVDMAVEVVGMVEVEEAVGTEGVKQRVRLLRCQKLFNLPPNNGEAEIFSLQSQHSPHDARDNNDKTHGKQKHND